jgi:3-hydroxyisobutyrate dehydrogenase-like beta-hydroxyacid dehydrogenase
MNVAFFGTGNMGLPMARNLLRAGHSLAVWNRTRERARPLEAEGARIAATPADAARGCEAMVTMLADDRAVEEALFDGALHALPEDAVHAGMSTVSVALSKRLAEEHGVRGQGYVAAPVFGRPEAAAEKRLWVVAAGPPGQVERCRPLFDAIGRGVSVVGAQPEAANAVKLAGNLSIAAVIETLAEAYALAGKYGVAPRTLLDTINSALFASPLYANYGGIIADGRFEPPGFRLRLGLKDVRLLLEAAESVSQPLPLASLVRDRMLAAMAHGMENSDWSAFARMAEPL